jgi:hypothetical protein
MELELIKNSILEIRGKRVILDYELAKLYGIETKRLKESVRRNIRRFPEDFMFELSQEEWLNLRTQFATSSWGGKRCGQKFTDIEQVLNYLIQKDQKQVQQGGRKRIGF